MATNVLQITTGAVQALSNFADASSNVVDLTSKAIEASTTLEHVHSCMEAKAIELHKIKGCVEDEFRIYWFPKKQFDPWLRMVEASDGQVRALTTKFSNIQVFDSRVALSKAIESMCTEIDKVITQGKELGDALVKRETKRIVKLATPISITNILALMEKLKLILECLEDGSINTIRLRGDVGTGKRAIIEHLNNHEAIANNMFDIVLSVPALDFENHNTNSSIEACIQHIIARRLGLSIGGSNDVNIMASKIHAELDGAKYLLLLDDVKVDIKLETIGIPSNTNGSKIVYTTSLPYVRPFSPFFPVETERLCEGDSWQMFEEILNHDKDMLREHQIGIIARKVVKWCDGLFSLIKIVAENFKSRISQECWEDGLQMLRKPAENGDIYMQALKNFLHFSYDGLEGNQKICFLFCALYPEDSKIPIDCLFDCWTTHKFLEYGNVEKAGMSRQRILEHLLAMALLKESSNKQYITMDRIFRAAALKILQDDDQFECLVAEEALEKLEENCCENIHWISLADSEIEDLPTTVMCPNLTTLFLQKNSELKSIPSSFFDHMEKLIVLDLCGTGIESLLPMCNLLRLEVLYANGCNISNVLPFNIEGLDNLEVLDIRGTTIEEIPHDIKKLKHLRRLMISILGGGNVDHLRISELSSLKELIIDVKSDEDKHLCMSCCNEVIADIIEKIDTLKELSMLQFRFSESIVDVIQARSDTLKIFVPKQDSLEHVLQDRRVRSNALQVNIGLRMAPNYEIPMCFYDFDSFVLSCDGIANDPVIENVWTKVKAIILIKDESIEHLDHVGISGSSMRHIQGCLVQRCSKMETLMLTGRFSSLKTLVLSKCSRLKVLFSSDVVQQVMGVEHLEIRDCSAIEEINMLSTDGGADVFPKLTTLVLYNLQRLMRICSVQWSSVNTVQIHTCPKLKELPLNINCATKLRKIKVQETWWNDLRLARDIKQKFRRYCEFSDMPV